MLTSVSTLPPRTRMSLSHATSAHALGSAVPSLLHRQRQYQQVRAFGFGWWANSIDRDQHREARRRFRALHHKQHVEAFSRRLMWEQQLNSDESPSAFKRCGGRHSQPKRFFAFGKHGGRDTFGPDEKTTGSRSGQESDNARPAAWGDFLFRDIQNGKAAPRQPQNSWASPFDDICSYVSRHAEILKEVGLGSSSQFPPQTTKSGEDDYFIDPITNRKVFKLSSKKSPDENVSTSGNTFNSYRSRVPSPTSAKKSGASVTKKATGATASPASDQTYDADLPPTAAELRAYQKVMIDSIASKPVQKSEEYVRQNQPDLSAISDSSDANYMTWKYKGTFWGRQPDQVEQRSSPKYNDLAKYAPIVDEVSAPTSQGTASPRYDDLQKYKTVQYNEPDGKPLVSEVSESFYDPDELAKYRPLKWNEPDGRASGHCNPAPSYNTAELDKYQPFMWNEPDGQPTTPVEPGHHGYDQAELQQYKPLKHNEPDGKPISIDEENGHNFGYDLKEVQQYEQGVKWNESNGNPTSNNESTVDFSELAFHGAVNYEEPSNLQSAAPVDSLTESLRQSDQESRSMDKASDEACSKILHQISSLGNLDDEELSLRNGSRPSGSIPAAGQPSKSKPEREELESAMTRMNAEADAIDKMASITIKSKQKRSTQHMTKTQRRQAVLDPHSTQPQGLETSYAEECQGMTTWPTFVKSYSKKAKTGSVAVEEATAPPPDESNTMYKILAYDPATQAISTAETASTVHATAVPLTPAEALLRLSHPTKFFPHFRPLEAQGFEIASGSGDVLVFRKSRGVKQATSAVNPIDKTGARDTSPTSPIKSASPSGFSNPDPLLPLEESATAAVTVADLPTTPKFRSNIDVRREEPVFSGAKVKANKADEDENSKKPGIAKRMLVGATWVAGVSYVLGLAGEQLTGAGSSPKN
ncbi:hypothetical protein CMQ_3659 [Grosmannia clavigera kw1407]|uniref:Uncharacterized protein n=1 Tax=Grosmannia clavigera (strain kw1407 / UAMH 11150) TaxID=655863 RepID=F0X832_GROCL|nr:uncharacterized protein CMQ_3659 [Grosmannia clavigera kw1407]EFX05590.1 hypothetical protein CMQ_3659 [Grosmannia clavigera kw1407]